MSKAVTPVNHTSASKTISALLFVLAGSLYSSHALADVTLNVDDNIKVTAINGQAVNTNFFAPIKTTFTLKPGAHAITAKYDRLFELRGDEHDYLRSGNVSVTANLADNQTYTLVMPNQPDTYELAKDYAKRPTLAVKLDNQIIASAEATTSSDGGILAGITGAVGSVFSGGNDAKASNQQAIESLGYKTVPTHNTGANPASSRPVAVSPVTVMPVTTTPVATSSNASTLDSFMQLWLNATPAERAKIRQWVAE